MLIKDRTWAFCPPVQPAFHKTRKLASDTSLPFPSLAAIPTGRVADMDAWIQLSSDSLQKFTGKSLFDYMKGVSEPSQVHDHERYAVLSHGVQDDPIYCYFNKAAFLQFQFSEDEVYQLPSRYSAPDGAERESRAEDVQQAVAEDVKELGSVIRQTKHGELFEMVNVILWNVYDESGERVGQTAFYDRDLVRPVSSAKKD